MRRRFFWAVGLTLVLSSSPAWTQPSFGFEDEALGDIPNSPWETTFADDARIVASENAQQYPVYAEFNTTVIPNRGAQMLRLSSPKDRNEEQNRGINRIKQTFTSTAETITFAVRIFSFEHRGDDRFSVAINGDLATPPTVTDGNGMAFSLPVTRGTPPSCSTLPCDLILDVGNRQDKLDSGWKLFKIANLPTDGRLLEIQVELNNGQNEALSSWAFVDSTNSKPEARITYNPGSASGTIAQEADFIVADCLNSTDADGDELTCNWRATGPGVPNVTATGETAVFSFADQGQATIFLDLTDGESTVTSSVSIPIVDAPPLVNAIDIEVLQGSTAPALCRYVDPGVNDTHDVMFSILEGSDGIFSNESQAREGVPALASGFGKADFNAGGLLPGEYNAECRVTDQFNGTFSYDRFNIRVLSSSQLATRVANNVQSVGNIQPATGQHTLFADGGYLGAFDVPGTHAVFELRDPNGNEFPVGAEINVQVQVPADYDAVLLSGSSSDLNAAPWISAPWVSAPWISAPWINVPFVSLPFISVPWISLPFISAPWVNAPWINAPWINAPITNSPWINAGYQYSDFPLSQVGLAAPDGSQISGIDVSFDDLGSLNVQALNNDPVRVKALSAEFGTEPEHMLVKMGPGEEKLYLAIIPQTGAFSTAPFNIQVESSQQPSQEQLLGTLCTGEPLVPNSLPNSGNGAVQVLRNYGTNSLIVTQRERMMATFGLSSDDFNTWLSTLDGFFSMVGARVISVPAEWYYQADTQPCVVAHQNDIAEKIKQAIEAHLDEDGASFEYVQLMGSLDIIPPYYTPDETQTGYEGLYAPDLWTRPGTPLSVAILEGNNLTDAYYVDRNPQPFRGRQLYVEDLSVSRMVETPQEITRSAERFVANSGYVSISSTQVTGYDFFIDGTEATVEALTRGGFSPSRILNDDLWSADELRCQFFGQGDGCHVSELGAVNAHMSYNGGISAIGYSQNNPAEVFGSTESATMFDFPEVLGITFSIGCHSGLSVPDAWALPDNVGLPLNPARDWVQELGMWIGAYTFAYGDTEVADRGTEGIMPIVIEKFLAGETLGKALIKAKWEYGTGIYEFGVYDEKSMIALNLFGMPQAKIAPSMMMPVTSSIQPSNVGGGFNLNLVGDSSTTGALELQSNALGSYYTINDQAQAVVGRPLQPVIKPIKAKLVLDTEIPAHGFVIRGGAFNDMLNFDPLFPTQVHDWVSSTQEPNLCVRTMTPAQLGAVTRFETPDGPLQTVIIQPGQFECTVPSELEGAVRVTGTERIWTRVDGEITYPDRSDLDGDFQPPQVLQQDLLANPDTGDVTATFTATDASGMREIIALIYEDDDGVPGGPGSVTSVPIPVSGTTAVATQILPGAYRKRLAFQYVDAAGNVTAKTLKGSLLQSIEVNIATSVFNTQGQTLIIVQIENFDTLLAPYMTVDFGDNTERLVLELTNADGTPKDIVSLQDGNATITLSYDYSGYTEPQVTVATEVRASGAQGRDEATLFACSDPIDALIADGDIVACGVDLLGDQILVDLYVAGNISNNVSYRLRIADTNQQIKYGAGAITAPNKLKAQVSPLGSDGLRFSFRASQAGYSGGAFGFQLSTQDGVSGGASAGTVDVTEEYSFKIE